MEEKRLETFVNAFLKKLDDLNSSDVNISVLADFLKNFTSRLIRLKDTILWKEIFSEFREIFQERTAELGIYPNLRKGTTLALISSLKSFCNYFNCLDSLQFNESTIKKEVIAGYEDVVEQKTGHDLSIMPTNKGKITSFLFAIDTYDDEFFPMMALLQAKQFQNDFCGMCVYSKDAALKRFQNYLSSRDFDSMPRMLFLKQGDSAEPNYVFSAWIRDGAVRRCDGSIVEPYRFPRNMRHAYDNVVAHEGTDLQQSELFFEGGNIRTTESLCFVGYNDIYLNAAVFRDQRAGIDFYYSGVLLQDIDFRLVTDRDIDFAIERFANEFHKRIIPVGLKRDVNGRYERVFHSQEIFHIDMVVTPLNDREILVAKNTDAPYLDALAESLSQQHFVVYRVPYHEVDVKDDGSVLQRRRRRARGAGPYAAISYNNVLLEEYYHQETGRMIKNVYLPEYRLGLVESAAAYQEFDYQAANLEARLVYERFGYQVIPIPVALRTTQGKGSLNCLCFEHRIFCPFY